MDPSEQRTLQTIAVPGLRVDLIAITPAEAMFHPEAMPAVTALEDDQPHPLPAHLPAGLQPRRLGEAYCAADAAGAFQVSWIELHLPAGATLSVPWDLSDGPAPAMQGFQFKGRDAVAIGAVWSAVSRERLPMIVTRAGPDSCWLTSGRLPLDELARVAVSLPAGPPLPETL